VVGVFSLMLLGELAGVLRLKLCETATFVACGNILRFDYKYRLTIIIIFSLIPGKIRLNILVRGTNCHQY
jgi:hypothetical protein